VVATPARIATAIREAWLQPSVLSSSLQVLVLDEADLLLSYGYADDLQVIKCDQCDTNFECDICDQLLG
jgi:ATP-dependent RNA helicase DDX56/DBP9